MKSLRDRLGRFFKTDAHAARAAKKWADEHFAEPRREIAQRVVLSIASALCVPIENISPETNLVEDLNADEEWEWKTIMLHIEEVMGRKFSPSVRFSGYTVTDLIEFTAAALPTTNEKEPSRVAGSD